MVSINQRTDDIDESRPLLLGHRQSILEKEENENAIRDGFEVVPNAARIVSFQDVRMNIAAGMMDLSLFIANCNQLANVIRAPEGIKLTALEVTSSVLICLSIFLQVFVVLLLIWKPPQPTSTIRSNRGIVTCIFLILIINVFVACLNNEQQHVCPAKQINPQITAE